MIRKYHNHKPQTTPWHREEEPLNHHGTPGRQIKQSNKFKRIIGMPSFPDQFKKKIINRYKTLSYSMFIMR